MDQVVVTVPVVRADTWTGVAASPPEPQFPQWQPWYIEGYAPGKPSVALLIDEFLTRKSVPPLVVMQAGALELYSLFCTTYLPPATDLVC